MREKLEGIELLEDLNELLEKEIRSVVKSGEIKPDQYENLSKAVCMMKDTKKAEKIMLEMESYGDYGVSNGRHYSDMSMTRGRSPITGRYVSMESPMRTAHHMNDGYSMHSYKDRILADLENRIQNAPTERDRLFVEGIVNYIDGQNQNM